MTVEFRLCAGTALALGSVPAFAIPIDPGPAVAIACTADYPSDILRGRLAEAILSQAGALPSDIQADETLEGATPGERAMFAVNRGSLSTAPHLSSAIKALRSNLEMDLAATSRVPEKQRKVRIVNPPPYSVLSTFLFDRQVPLQMACAKPELPKSVKDEREKMQERPPIALRGKVEELGATGEDAKKAGAVKIGLKRVRTQKDDGSSKTTTSLSVAGTAGVQLNGRQSAAPVFLYGSYALSRERTRPADPTKKQSDGDVHGLELGLAANDYTLLKDKDLSLTGSVRAAYVFDFAHHARRLKIAGSIVPGVGRSFAPLCDIGGYTPVEIGDLRFRTRCLLALEAEGSHVIDAGSFDFKDRGEFIAFGGRAEYQVAVPMGQKIDLIGSIAYRYLPMISGVAPDIKRWDAGIKYRFWTESGLGLDFGLTWARGQEPITYAKENKLELGFGIIR